MLRGLYPNLDLVTFKQNQEVLGQLRNMLGISLQSSWVTKAICDKNY